MTHSIDEAIEALLNYSQADADGIMVVTSRQAIHEVVDHARATHSAGHLLVNKLEACSSSMTKAYALAQAHTGAVYDGPTYSDALDAFKAVLSAMEDTPS